jgi:methionyl-tRNA formyltransferase
MSLRVVFMGTPDFAVPTLSEIVGQGHDVVAVYTRPPAAAGRGMELKPSPVHTMADRFGLPVLTPKTLRTEEASEIFRSHNADVAVVVAYGMLLPKAVLEAPELGCLNLHASLLPRWRGAAPIQRAIMAGDGETGVAVMKMEEGLDTGPVAMVERLAIAPDMNAGELHDRLMVLGADLMVRALAALSRGGLSFTPQPEEGVTYAHKLKNEEALIDWSKPAQAVHDHIRGLRATLGQGSGSPATLIDNDGTISCGEGAIRLIQVQRAGKGPVSFEEFLRGVRLGPGAKFA